MPSFAELLQQGTAHAWLFILSAILLGALHGLEPGHSKTMMAAYIVAIRGTVGKAGLLGLAATVSHTEIGRSTGRVRVGTVVLVAVVTVSLETKKRLKLRIHLTN